MPHSGHQMMGTTGVFVVQDCAAQPQLAQRYANHHQQRDRPQEGHMAVLSGYTKQHKVNQSCELATQH